MKLRAALLAGCGSQRLAVTALPRVTGKPVLQPRPTGIPPELSRTGALRVSTGTWRGGATSYTYRWEDCDSSGSACAGIAGARGSAYTVGTADRGHTIRAVVTARNAHGAAVATSPATAPVGPSAAPAINHYFAQAAQGSGSGSSCANAEAVSTLASSAAWTPGDTIGLCGTITSSITAHGSGTSGKPITLYFEPGASISEPACATACLTLDNESYITVDGGAGGVIQNTANGTGLRNDTGDLGIAADPCNGCTIEHLTIRDIYVRTSASDTGAGASNSGCLSVSGSNLTVADNTMSDAHWCVLIDENDHPEDSNLRFYANNISDTDHGFALAAYNNGGGKDFGPFFIFGNYVHDYVAWDSGAADVYHHDGFHCYSSGSAHPYIGRGLYLYDNVWGGPVGHNDTAQIFLEGTPDGTPCATTTSPIYIFNNVVLASSLGSPTNQYLTLAAGTEHIYNNTVLGGHRDDCVIYNDDPRPATFEDNLVAGCLQEVSNAGAIDGLLKPAYNLYAAGGSHSFGCGHRVLGFTQLPAWRSCIGGDPHSRTAANALVSADGSLMPGSPAIGAGRNLSSICAGQPTPGLGALCENILGSPRPRTGAWNVGAY